MMLYKDIGWHAELSWSAAGAVVVVRVTIN